MPGPAETEAFRRLVEEHFAPLAAFARSVLGSDLEAEDAAQEAFVVLYRRRSHLREGISPRPYLYRIALRRCLARLRRDARRRALWRLLAPLAPREAPPPSEPLDLFFTGLTERQRAIAHLHFAEDLEAPEIGARLGIAPSTVRVHLLRIRESLRSASGPSLLAERCPDVH